MTIFLKRFFSAFFLLCIFILTFFSKNEFFFLFLIFIVSLISLYEMGILLKLKKIESYLFWCISLAPFILSIFDFSVYSYMSFISCLFWTFIGISSVSKGKIILISLKPFYGLIIIFGLFISTVYLFYNDRLLLFISLIIIWLSDIFAYLVGKIYGKKKLAPNVSPGKTYEGVYGAFLANLFFIAILSIIFNYSFKPLLFLTFVIIPLSIYGDLFESLLKRNANKKDSGALIPGHGGFLDRIDGLCSTIPAVTTLSLLGFAL